jgi:hypothetical protein
MDLDSITVLTLLTICNNSSVAASERSCLVEKEYISYCGPEMLAAAGKGEKGLLARKRIRL